MAERKGERIYVRNEAGGLEPLKEERFGEEAELQRLLAEYPELLEGTQIRPDDPRRWILITREQGIPATLGAGDRWSVDHLVIDQDAMPTLVEVKRGDNTELRRTVITQMLDYAAHAHLVSAERMRATFAEQPNAEEQLLKLFDDPEIDDPERAVDEFWKDVARNLEAKRFRLLFVADAIPDELSDIVKFLNEQMPKIEVLAVEIKQFRGETLQTLVPRVIGRQEKPNRSTTTSEDHPLYQEFWEGFLDAFKQNYKDWEVHRSTKGAKHLTNFYLTFDACGKDWKEMHYSFDYARREGDPVPTRVNFWVEPAKWREPSRIEEAEHIVRELWKQRDQIERRFGERFDETLSWDQVEGRKKPGIHIQHPDENLAIGDRTRWPEVRDWGITRLGALRDAIQPHLDSLS